MATENVSAALPSPTEQHSMVLFAEIAQDAHTLDEIMAGLIADDGGPMLVAVQAVIQRIGAMADAASYATGRRVVIRDPNAWHYTGAVLEAMDAIDKRPEVVHG